MPFLPLKDKPYALDPSRYKPACVIVSYTDDGNIKPMYVKYKNSHEEDITLKIDYVKQHKDLIFAISITCLTTVHDKQTELTVVYLKEQYRWVIQNH